MMDVNNVLQVYLGTDANGGYHPVGGDTRLRATFPDRYEQVREMIRPYLETGFREEWINETWEQTFSAYAAALKERFPELSDLTVRSLVNRFAYGWR